ncbi:hypothetical protein ACWCOV_26750 [Kribbella sp. NPDC002412]
MWLSTDSGLVNTAAVQLISVRRQGQVDEYAVVAFMLGGDEVVLRGSLTEAEANVDRLTKKLKAVDAEAKPGQAWAL